MGAIESIPLFITIVVSVGMLPFFVVATTSFVKISIVLLIVRNALGIQQMPANILLYVIAIVLSIAIMGPILQEILQVLTRTSFEFNSFEAIEAVFTEVTKPIKGFLTRYSSEDDRLFFIDSVAQVWRGSGAPTPLQSDMSILIPSFLVAELRRAFEIGFLLYLPFLAIDFAVSAVLMALGMQMMSPVTISTPIKLLLFVLIDGWSRLLQGLILSYAEIPV